MILWLLFFGDVTQFALGRTDLGRYAVAIYLAGLGLFTGFLGIFETGEVVESLELLGG